MRSISYSEEALAAGQNPFQCPHGEWLTRKCGSCDLELQGMADMMFAHDRGECFPNCDFCATARFFK